MTRTINLDLDVITSDHHFGHARIGELCARPLDTSQMHEEMIRRWNSVVTPNMTVHHLGDFSLAVTRAERIRPRLNGKIILYAGNHDECWTHKARMSDERRRNMLARYRNTFDEVIPDGQETVLMNGQQVILSHLPYYGDSRHDARYEDIRPADEGLPIVCGHVHNAWQRLYGTDGRIHRGQVNVGVDVWDFYPVPARQVATLLGIAT